MFVSAPPRGICQRGFVEAPSPAFSVWIVVVFISLPQLEKNPVRFNVDVPTGEIEFGGNISQNSDLHVEGRAELLNHAVRDIRVHGDLKVDVSASCDRCLDNVSIPVQNHFDLVYFPAAESEGGEDEVAESAIDVGFYEGNGLALNDVLREVVLLALPMQIVCRESCKGICPVCGEDKNQRECDCHTPAVDDRWSGLKDFRTENRR